MSRYRFLSSWVCAKIAMTCNTAQQKQLSSAAFSLCPFRWQIFKNTPTPKEELPFWSDVVLGFRPMSEAELQKFPQHQFGQAFTTLKCECPPYLLWLEKRLVWLQAGHAERSPGRGTAGSWGLLESLSFERNWKRAVFH